MRFWSSYKTIIQLVKTTWETQGNICGWSRRKIMQESNDFLIEGGWKKWFKSWRENRSDLWGLSLAPSPQGCSPKRNEKVMGLTVSRKQDYKGPWEQRGRNKSQADKVRFWKIKCKIHHHFSPVPGKSINHWCFRNAHKGLSAQQSFFCPPKDLTPHICHIVLASILAWTALVG